MKKLFLFIFIIISFPIMLNAQDYNYVPMGLEDSLKAEGISYNLGDYKFSDEKVNVYLFRGQGCTYCKHFLQFVSDTLLKDYGEYFNLISYEIWRNDDNNYLMETIKNKLDVDSTGVPFIVIGENYFIGYSEQRNDSIISLIKIEYENNNRTDLVKEIAGNIKEVSNSFEKIETDDNSDDIINTNKDKKSSFLDMQDIIIISIILILVLILCYVIFTYRKLNKNIRKK